VTPQEALTAIQSRLETFEASVANLPNYMSPEMDAAVQVLADFIKQVNEHGSTDLEWGEPGDCYERITNDEEVAHALGFEDAYSTKLGDWLQETEYADIKAKAKEFGVGRHYGDPHCIWCLEAS